MSEWFAPNTGPTGNNGRDIESSGTASAAASTDVAHMGNSSAKLTITTPSTPESRTRLFRWLQPCVNSDLYYGAWYYFPRGSPRMASAKVSAKAIVAAPDGSGNVFITSGVASTFGLQRLGSSLS